MARKKDNPHDNPLDQIGGFLEALFGSCMGEDRKVGKKKDDTIDPFQTKPDNQGNIFGNLVSAFTPDKSFVQDARQMRDMVRYKEGGIGSEISTATKYLSGQEPPGIFSEFANAFTGKTPNYALPLLQDQREKTVESLKRYSEENPSNDSHRLSQSAKDIANKLEERDNFGYRHQSLASAAHEAGMTKEKIQVLFEYLNKSIASAQAKDLASDLRQNSQNKQLSLRSSGLSPSDNLSPQPNQRSSFSYDRLEDGAAGARGTHTSRLRIRNQEQAGVKGGPNSLEGR